MTKPRERIPVAKEYSDALGRATYNFAYLEWSIIWLHETIERGALSKAPARTAGQIANSFANAVGDLSANEVDKPDLVALSNAFKDFVKERNKLMHGNPFTAATGEQRLRYVGKNGQMDWKIPNIDKFSDRAAELSLCADKLLNSGRYENWNSWP